MTNQTEKLDDGRYVAEDRASAQVFEAFGKPYVMRADIVPPTPSIDPTIAAIAALKMPKVQETAAYKAETQKINAELAEARTQLSAVQAQTNSQTLTEAQLHEYALQCLSADVRGVERPTLPITPETLAVGQTERENHLNGVLDRYRAVHSAPRLDHAASHRIELELVALRAADEGQKVRHETQSTKQV